MGMSLVVIHIAFVLAKGNRAKLTEEQLVIEPWKMVYIKLGIGVGFLLLCLSYMLGFIEGIVESLLSEDSAPLVLNCALVVLGSVSLTLSSEHKKEPIPRN